MLRWHEESEWLQVLSASPAVLCLQIWGTAPSTMCKAPVVMSVLTVHVPCYTGDNLEVVWIKYRVRAGTLHHGHEANRGHCSSVLYQGDTAWSVDDGRPPMRAHLTRYEAENLYIVWLSKDPTHKGEDMAADCPQRGLSGAVTCKQESAEATSHLGSVLMKYF